MAVTRIAGSIVFAAALCAGVGAQVPASEPTALKAPLLTPERIAALPSGQQEAWRSYTARSDEERRGDEATVARELFRLGRARLVRAPLGRSISLDETMTVEWLRGEEGRRLAEAIVSFQSPSGGWSKRLDYSKGSRAPGQGYASEGDWSYVATFDNDATVSELRVLSRAFDATGHATYREAFVRGLDHILRAQFPTGCWPQGYPLSGSYHDAATFNDDAMLNVIALLREVADGTHAAADGARQDEARTSVRRGVSCIVSTQVRVNGERTAWGAQHDPLTLAPVGARAYEHPSVDAAASSRVVETLMAIDNPDAEVVAAVHAAVAWFGATAVRGHAYEKGELVARADADPIWPRFSEVGTNRAIFSNRDGVVRYEWAALLPERRYGYAWYTGRPARVLKAFELWQRQHPLPR